MIAVRGVLLTGEEAAYVVRALELLVKVLPASGSSATPRLLAVAAELARRTQAAACDSVAPAARNAPSGGGCAPSPPNRPDDQPHGQATIGTGDAARILGITGSAVRQLAARGALPGSRRPAGRWIHDAAAVVARAERQAARRRI